MALKSPLAGFAFSLGGFTVDNGQHNKGHTVLRTKDKKDIACSCLHKWRYSPLSRTGLAVLDPKGESWSLAVEKEGKKTTTWQVNWHLVEMQVYWEWTRGFYEPFRTGGKSDSRVLRVLFLASSKSPEYVDA